MHKFNKEEISSILKRCTPKKEKVMTFNVPSFAIFLVFLILKLTNTVNWSWLIVTLPLWIGPALVIGFLLALMAFIGIVALIIFVLALCGIH